MRKVQFERTKNATRNIVFGLLLKIFQIFVPFLMRTVMIYFMGIQYLGLNSLFTSILQILNLAELGVGNAMVFSMYKPVSENDINTICALMRLYKIYYRVIGIIIAGIGLFITPFIPSLISDTVPEDINIYILYILNLAATVLSYWLFAYKNSILMAHQRNDVVSKITLIVNMSQYGVQLLVLCFLRNYYIYVIVMLITQAITNIVIALVADKMFPNYKPKGTLTKNEIKQINRRIKDLFTSKIGTVVLNSADTIVISSFLGLTVLAVYQNYYFILTSVIGLVTIIFNSCTAGIGNSLITDGQEKNFNDLKKLTFLICWIAGICTCCFLCLFQPFMEIWVGKDLELPFSVIVCFCIYYYLYEINQLLNTYKDAGGIWHKDRYRPLVTSLVNLGMNLILVQFWGIYGVILSTVLSMIIVGMPWLFSNLFTTLFDKRYRIPYLKTILFYAFVGSLACFITWFICNCIDLNKYLTLIIRLMICCVVPNIVFYIAYRNNSQFNQVILLIDKITRGKLKICKIFLKNVNCQDSYQ